jgi:hypothetical protein
MGSCVSSSAALSPNDSFCLDEDQRKASMRLRKIAFENRQLCRIQSFRGSGDHSAAEREQLIAIERRRTAPATLSPYPERDLRFYLEVTCHVPNEDEDNPVVIAPSPPRTQPAHTHRRLHASASPDLNGNNNLRAASSSHLLSRSLSDSSHSLSSQRSTSSASLTSPYRRKVELSPAVTLWSCTTS